MNEERLIEITLGLVATDGPLSMLVYLSTLDNDEIKQLGTYIRGSKNFYLDLMKFAFNYLDRKKIKYDESKRIYNYEDVKLTDGESKIFVYDDFMVTRKR